MAEYSTGNSDGNSRSMVTHNRRSQSGTITGNRGSRISAMQKQRVKGKPGKAIGNIATLGSGGKTPSGPPPTLLGSSPTVPTLTPSTIKPLAPKIGDYTPVPKTNPLPGREEDRLATSPGLPSPAPPPGVSSRPLQPVTLPPSGLPVEMPLPSRPVNPPVDDNTGVNPMSMRGHRRRGRRRGMGPNSNAVHPSARRGRY